MSLRLDSQCRSTHDRIAREKAKVEKAALKKKRGQKEEEESATLTTPASK
jgi:hypothetical protein